MNISSLEASSPPPVGSEKFLQMRRGQGGEGIHKEYGKNKINEDRESRRIDNRKNKNEGGREGGKEGKSEGRVEKKGVRERVTGGTSGPILRPAANNYYNIYKKNINYFRSEKKIS